MTRGISHPVVAGTCVQCGRSIETLLSAGESVSDSAGWQVVDPAGNVHSKRRGKRLYTHALIRQNKGDADSSHYFVDWATSEANVHKESRVLRDQRSYSEIIKLVEVAADS